MRFLDNSLHLLRVWLANARTSVIRDMEFRVNFLSGLLRQLLWLCTFIFLVEVIFQNAKSLSGWSQADVLVILALSRLIEGTIDSLFSRNIMEFPDIVQLGKFDYYLTKPVPVQFYSAFLRFRILNTGNVIAGIFLLTYALMISEVTLRASHVLAFILLAFLGIIVYYSILIILASAVFVLEQFHSFPGLSHLLSQPLTVPFDIFPRGPRIALTYLLPLAFFVFVPAQALTGRLSWWQIPVAIGLAALFLLLANVAWRAGLRRYTSASS